MKVQIDTIQCRRLYERLRSGRAQLEQAQRDVQHARMHLRAQTCPAQKQALRQAEQAIAALEEELERARSVCFRSRAHMRCTSSPCSHSCGSCRQIRCSIRTVCRAIWLSQSCPLCGVHGSFAYWGRIPFRTYGI